MPGEDLAEAGDDTGGIQAGAAGQGGNQSLLAERRAGTAESAVASLRRELAEAAGALDRARAELAEARERTAELEARLRQNPAELLQAAIE